MLRVVVFLLLSLSGFACSDKTSKQLQLTPAEEHGRTIYVTNCLPCHHESPALPGALGPSVAGASLELLQARVLHATYPPGYTPKRTSRAMPALPHLKDDLTDLAAYLRTAESR